MQSSVGLAFRALVMLACLALVPLLAIYGKQLPDFYRAVVDAYKARTQPKGADPLAAIGSDAPAWAPTNDRALSGSKNAQTESLAPAALNTAAATAQPLASANGSAVSTGAVQPASFAGPVDAGKPADPIATSSPPTGTTAAAPPAGGGGCVLGAIPPRRAAIAGTRGHVLSARNIRRRLPLLLRGRVAWHCRLGPQSGLPGHGRRPVASDEEGFGPNRSFSRDWAASIAAGCLSRPP